ncbi:MAG: hypothetical protein ACKO8I_20205 [Cyanobacteriota bacterium]
MAKQSVTVRIEPELVRWFRDRARLPRCEGVLSAWGPALAQQGAGSDPEPLHDLAAEAGLAELAAALGHGGGGEVRRGKRQLGKRRSIGSSH